MKKLIALIILGIFFAAMNSVPVYAYTDPGYTLIQGADCNNYWQKVKLPSTHQGHPVKLISASGTGTWAWNNKTKASFPKVIVKYCFGPSCNTVATTQPAGGGTIYKSDWCDPVTGKVLSRSSTFKPITLPKQQPYLLLDDGQNWCYMVARTPLLGEGGNAWCFSGEAPEDINTFCLQPNYQNIFGCTLQNYKIHYIAHKWR